MDAEKDALKKLAEWVIRERLRRSNMSNTEIQNEEAAMSLAERELRRERIDAGIEISNDII